MAYPNVIYGDYGDERVVSSSKIGSLQLGVKMILPNGKEYLHSKVGGTALVQGKLYQQEALASGTGNIKSLAVIAGSAQEGDRQLTITMSATGAMTKDQYTDGSIFTSSSAGVGGAAYAYTVKTCSSAAAGAASVIGLYDKIHETIAGGTTLVGVRVNPQANVLLTTADTVGVGTLAGVSCSTAAASSFCWLQTKGPAAVFTDATTPIVGIPVTASTTVAGAIAVENITASSTAGNMIHKSIRTLGICLNVSASTEYSLIDLDI